VRFPFTRAHSPHTGPPHVTEGARRHCPAGRRSPGTAEASILITGTTHSRSRHAARPVDASRRPQRSGTGEDLTGTPAYRPQPDNTPNPQPHPATLPPASSPQRPRPHRPLRNPRDSQTTGSRPQSTRTAGFRTAEQLGGWAAGGIRQKLQPAGRNATRGTSRQRGRGTSQRRTPRRRDEPVASPPTAARGAARRMP
jgi:hypothetical protein